VSLHPLAVFLGPLIGGKLFGLLGVILAVRTIAEANCSPPTRDKRIRLLMQ
jgi:hypothetical protein